jgi:SAM-dependent methyltransferase
VVKFFLFHGTTYAIISRAGLLMIQFQLSDSRHMTSLSSLDTIFKLDRDEASKLFSPYFVKYHSRLFRESGYLDCITGYVKWWSEILDVQDKEVLDVGSGFGIYTLMFSFFKAKHVYGADHNSEKIEQFEKLLSLINPPLGNVTPSLQDGLRLNFDDHRFPAIFVKDVISHVRELDPFLAEMSRLLSPGGRILITDENNALEWAGRRERKKKWLEWEYKGIREEDLRAGEPHMTYREMRREDIGKYIVNLDLSKMDGINQLIPGFENNDHDMTRLLDILAKETMGFWGEELLKATDQLLKKGKFDKKPEFPYRHPRTGEFMEREFDPFKLADEMNKHGIGASVIRPRFFTQKRLLNIAGKVISITHPVSAFVQPNFYVLGKME